MVSEKVNIEDSFKRYIEFLENLTSENVSELSAYIDNDVIFQDPFHRVQGAEQMVKIINKMFNRVSNVNFCVIDHVVNNDVVFFGWDVDGLLLGKNWQVNGVPYLKYNKDLKILEHIECWDAASQLYEQFPVVGSLFKHLRRRISI